MNSNCLRKRNWLQHIARSVGLPLYFKSSFVTKCNRKHIIGSVLSMCCILLGAFYTSHAVRTRLHDATRSIDYERHLLTTESSSCFAKAADPAWLAIFCFLGTIYMFIALSIVCDEFFVPSLETISLRLDMSNDVAGSTLMAAGGSAPELFTSLIGTFQETDVGFAAIVGSAVFNVLFVIGICAFSAPEPLQLTWWPLARDCSYYAMGLAVLSVCFSQGSTHGIEWHESLLLFVLYIGYVVLMKYNQRVYDKLMQCKQWFRKDSGAKQQLVRSVTQVTVDTFSTADTHDKKKRTSSVAARDSTFRAGMLNILLKDDWDWGEVLSMTVVNSICGDVKLTFDALDLDGNGTIDINELGQLLTNLKADTSQSPIEDLMKQLDTNGDGTLSFKEFSLWYLKSEERVLGEMKWVFDTIDADKDGVLTLSEIKAFLQILGVEGESHQDVVNTFKRFNIDTDTDQGMSYEQFKQWFILTDYYQQKLHRSSRQAECMESADSLFAWPETWRARFWYVLTVPLLVLLTSVPDVRKPGKQKYCYLSFTISILWIGVFSFCLVEWTSIVGDTLQIPLVVMGLTFLAAGTSVPDLLSSVIVALQGHGDMAVSSSIGSNIFDILVGLPVPWLLYSALNNGKPVTVSAESLEVSILILLAMLIAVVFVIKLANWRMTKRLGMAMMFFYIIFVTQDLIRADWSC